MSNQIIFTLEELKEFSKTFPLNLNNLSKFIEGKTQHQYAIVQKAMVHDLNQQLLTNMLFICNIDELLLSHWDKFIKANRAITDKWKEDLKLFKGC